MNNWELLLRLIPATRRYIGAVVAHNPDGTSSIQTYGGTSRARGQSVAIGQQAEIENGAVLREAPTLPTLLIEV